MTERKQDEMPPGQVADGGIGDGIGAAEDNSGVQIELPGKSDRPRLTIAFPKAVAEIARRLDCTLEDATVVLLAAGRPDKTGRRGKMRARYNEGRGFREDDWLRLRYDPYKYEQHYDFGKPLCCMWMGAEIIGPYTVEIDYGDLMALLEREGAKERHSAATPPDDETGTDITSKQSPCISDSARREAPAPEAQRRAPGKRTSRARPGPKPGTLSRFNDAALYPELAKLVRDHRISRTEAIQKLIDEGKVTPGNSEQATIERIRKGLRKWERTCPNSSQLNTN